jgi:hypothetical protein
MITDLDETLKQLLIKEMPIENNEVEVKFDLPKRKWAAKLHRPTINLYLYDIRENTELRCNEWVVERDDNGRATKKKAPIRIDLSYLVTAWTRTVEDEHRLLWRALWALFRNPVLPEEILQGSLKEATVPIPTSIAQPDKIPNIADLWGVLDNELKPAIHLVVTLPLDLAQVITGPLVLTKRIRVERGITGEGPFQEITQIAGTVRDEEGHPIAGATVSVKGTGFTTVTDEEGRFTFPNVPPGERALQVVAPGEGAREQAVTIPADKYDFQI